MGSTLVSLSMATKLLTFEEKWAVLGRTKFFRNGNPINRHITSSIWHGMKHHIYLIFQKATWSIGNGENLHFWTDRWLARPILNSWHILEQLHSSLNMKDGRCSMNGELTSSLAYALLKGSGLNHPWWKGKGTWWLMKPEYG
ncbi:hypothetical protein MTR_1g036830 [Medicago truncatula]|uniref:Uncharacterized protein n=1 Tax=Medicago truncatula TaxID=3880 RepID=A0A072VH27_MEDTR|nr:hypothetical protein MTR_1g036830 [Medicago truncatula]